MGMNSMSRALVLAVAVLILGSRATAYAQTTPASSPTPAPAASNGHSNFWIVGGIGFSAARAGCPTCPRDGVFTNGRALMVDLGFRATHRLDVGVELAWTSTQLVDDGADPTQTTFVMGVAQVRPWEKQGFFFKAGMGAGFVGNGLASPIGWDLKPPYTTNTLALVYGAGWVFQREKRFALQVYGTHHIAALGELTTGENTSVKNVLCNYWTAGVGFVFR